MLVYITHTETRDLTPRLERVLTEAGLRVAVLKANTVEPDRREEWVTKRVRAGVDVLLVHPRLVQTVLDLIDFPTIVWHEVEYSVYTMRQASRRSWRIGQTRPVRRVSGDPAGASVVARRAQAPGVAARRRRDRRCRLAAYGADADDLTLELARSLTRSDDVDEESLEALFAQARLAADGAQEASTLEISQSKHHRSQMAQVHAPTKNACLSRRVASTTTAR